MYKGWMQTWLVHSRRPFRLLGEIGMRQFIGFNLVGAGMIVSTMVHPIYLATILVAVTDPLVLWGDGGLVASAMIGVYLFNLIAGYAAMALLAGRTLRLRNRAGEAVALVGLPLYWLLMSLASYRALFQLITRPHHWEKTPHRRRSAGARAQPPTMVNPGPAYSGVAASEVVLNGRLAEF